MGEFDEKILTMLGDRVWIVFRLFKILFSDIANRYNDQLNAVFAKADWSWSAGSTSEGSSGVNTGFDISNIFGIGTPHEAEVPMEGETSTITTGDVVISGDMKGIQYASGRSGSLPRKHHNPANVTAKGNMYEGQIGTYEVNGTTFAAFSDPYYSIKAAVNSNKLPFNKSRDFNEKQWKINAPKVAAYGYIAESNADCESLVAIMARYAPFGHGSNNPVQYSRNIVAKDPGAFPKGVFTIVNQEVLRNNARIFYAVVAGILQQEQGTKVSKEYMYAVWKAIWHGGEEPTQENLNKKASKVTQSQATAQSKGSRPERVQAPINQVVNSAKRSKGKPTASPSFKDKVLSTNRLQKSTRYIDEIIVHCSDTPEGRPNTVQDINSWHRRRGWSCIGYNYVIHLDGTIHAGRDINAPGAHCENHNAHSIGVCYIGGCEATRDKHGNIIAKLSSKNLTIPKDTRTTAQKTALIALLTKLVSLYPDAKIYGHRNFSNKSCPSFDAYSEYRHLWNHNKSSGGVKFNRGNSTKYTDKTMNSQGAAGGHNYQH